MVLELHSRIMFEAVERVRDGVGSDERDGGICPGFVGLWPRFIIR